MMLHILFNSPFKVNINLMCSMMLKDNSIVALQDGVFIALNNNIFLKQVLMNASQLYLLEEDVVARGIKRHIIHNCNLINYYEFVRLTSKYDKYMNW